MNSVFCSSSPLALQLQQKWNYLDDSLNFNLNIWWIFIWKIDTVSVHDNTENHNLKCLKYSEETAGCPFFPTSKLTTTWKVNIRNGHIFFIKFLFPIQLFFHRLSWLRHYLELLTLCVNIAYNVTLNMQICTAQHLISHLSVTVPSVGSPAARVWCRGKCPTETR